MFGFQIILLACIIAISLPKPQSNGWLKFQVPSVNTRSAWSGYALLEHMKTKTLICFNLSGNKEHNDSVICQVDSLVRVLYKNNDTIHAISVHFSAGSTYGQFVRLVNTMKTELVPYYALWEDDFYTWRVLKPKPGKTGKIEPLYM
jgi:hypothetical protein